MRLADWDDAAPEQLLLASQQSCVILECALRRWAQQRCQALGRQSCCSCCLRQMSTGMPPHSFEIASLAYCCR